MLPKYHILSGFVFAYIIYWFTSITIFQAALIFLSAVLIDFDHYLYYMKTKKDKNLKKAYLWHKNLPKNHKPIMHIFHTMEFHVFITLLIYLQYEFLFILIGMLFHSTIDIIFFVYTKRFHVREFSLIRFLILKKKYPDKYF